MASMELIDSTTGQLRTATTADLAGTGGGSGGGSSGVGVIIGIDTTGTRWIMVVSADTSPPSISYLRVSDGVIGTPSGEFTPDSDQNGATEETLALLHQEVTLQATSGKQDESKQVLEQIVANTAPPKKVAAVEVNGVARTIDPVRTQVFKDENGMIISTIYFDSNGDFAGEA